jgi:antitoxin YefM
MNAATYTNVRKNLKHYFDKVYKEHDPVIVTRKNNENVIILSLDDYNSLTETHYLLSNEHNARRLKSSLNDSRNNKLIKKDLIEP